MSGQPGVSAFGIPDEENGGPADDIFLKGLDAETSPAPTPEVPAEENIPEPALDQAPSDVDTATAETAESAADADVPEGQPEGTETPEQSDEVVLLAGKYKTVEELERGYRESSREAQAIRAREVQAQRQYAELQNAVQSYVTQQQQAQAAAPPAVAGEPTDAELATWGLDRASYTALKPVIDRTIEAQLGPLRAQQEQAQQLSQAQYEAQVAAQEQQAAYASVQQTLGSFYAQHPEYAPGTDGNASIGELVNQWNTSWTGDPSGEAPGSFNVSDATSLEIAAEAAQRPMLARVLEANPGWFDTDAGMDLARQQATVLEATARAQTPAKSAGRTGATLPQVESGASGGGPRQLETQPRSPIDQMLADAESERGQSVFQRG